MALTLNIPGGLVQLNGNRVLCEVETDTLTGVMYKLLLKTTSLDGSFPEGIDAVEPDTDNKVKFYIQNRLTLPVEYEFTWPLTGAVAVEHPQMARKVAIDIGERFVQVVNAENVDTVNWAGLSENNQVLILKGGLSKHQQAKYNELNTTFYQEFIQAGRFLTLLPDGMKMSPGQPLKLWFVTKEATAQELALKAQYTTAAGVVYSVSHAVTINPDKIVELCVDLGTLGIADLDVSEYSVWLEKAGVAVGEIRSWKVDRNYYEQNIYLLYTNRVGGIDCLWLHGRKFTKMLPVESETSQRDARETDTQKRATREVDNKDSRRKWTFNTGHFEENDLEALPHLFDSLNIWLLEGNDIIPVMIEDGDNEYFNSLDNVHAKEITLTEAH